MLEQEGRTVTYPLVTGSDELGMSRRDPGARTQVADAEPDPRFTLANERTFLAWNRTALALVGGGLAAGQFVEFSSEAARLVVAVTPVILGALLSMTSVRRWQRVQHALRQGEPLPVTSVTTLVGASVAVLAVTIAVLLVTRIGGV